MVRFPIEFISGREGTGFMELNDLREVLRITDQDLVTVPDDPAYGYHVTGDEVFVSSDPAPEAPPDVGYGKIITKAAWRDRFTEDERILAELLAVDIPTASLETRTKAAKLRMFQRDIDNREAIELELPATEEYLDFLVSFGILTSERAVEIDDAPVQAHEVPQ